MRKKAIIVFLILSFSLFSAGFIHLGPIPSAGEVSLKIEPFSVKTGDLVKLSPGLSLRWQRITLPASLYAGSHYFVLYPHFEWGKDRITVKSNEKVQVFLDGEKLGEGKEVKAEPLLEKGKHFLLIKLHLEETKKVELEVKGDFKATLDPSHPLSLREIMDTVSVTRAIPSDDGRLVLVQFSRWGKDGKRERWWEVYSLPGGKLIRSFRGFDIRNVNWRPAAHSLSFIKKDALWLYPLEGKAEEIAEAKGLSGYLWSGDGNFLLYFVYKKRREYNNWGLNRIKDPAYRQKGWGGKYEIHRVWFPSKIDEKLKTVDAQPVEISPDGKYLLLSHTYFDRSRRPYLITEFPFLDLQTLKIKKTFNDPWVNFATWSPDGKALLLLAGPSSFGGICSRLPKGKIPNDYNGELIVYSLEGGKARCLTKDFSPSVLDAYWRKEGIFFTAEDKTFVRLYSIKDGKIEEINTGGEVTRSLEVGRDGTVAALITGVNFPHRLVVLKKGKAVFTLFPAQRDFSTVKWGKVEDWDLKIKGFLVKGRVYYPPGFNPNKKYPLIIYYYGGTSPITRDFGGRYPKEWWAAKGFVVYTLTPPGATGFGQRYSAQHVNDWGKISGKFILEAARRFIKTHGWVGKKGIIGASFGGFMTQYLVTRTDMFDAAVSHAGISMIPSYWGQGYWGYAYNAVSAAFSFPWNRRDIYVERSPLFSADKIKSPLLLLHGSVDTNVPPGESHQMFTALEILGRPVSLVIVKGENHWIMGYKHRIGWYMTIMGWFEKYLKGNSRLWDCLFEEK